MKSELALICLGMAAGIAIGWHAQAYNTRDDVFYARVQEKRANDELRRVLSQQPSASACERARLAGSR